MKAPRLAFPNSKMPSKPSTISVLLLLVCSLSVGCASLRTQPAYNPSLPNLKVAPMRGQCKIANPKTPKQTTEVPCILMVEQEWLGVLTELKAMCLALGNDEKVCGITTKADEVK